MLAKSYIKEVLASQMIQPEFLVLKEKKGNPTWA